MNKFYKSVDFSLSKRLSDTCDTSVIIWIFNIGAEAYWHKTENSLNKLSNSDVVNRIEEICILNARKQDILILHSMPDKYYINTLEHAGFKIPHIIAPEKSDSSMPISELVLNDENILEYLKKISENNKEVFFVPYAVTKIEEQIAKKCNLLLIGPSADTAASVNDKIFARKAAEEMKLDVLKGCVVSNIYEIEKAYKEFCKKGIKNILVKDPHRDSGKGIYFIDSIPRLYIVLKIIKKTVGEKCELIVEEFCEKKMDINYQIDITKNGDIEVFYINQSLVEDFRYKGTVLLSNDQEFFKNYHKFGQYIGRYLFEYGYTGTAGIDSIISKNNKIYPLLEINGRLNMSTYFLCLKEKLNAKQCHVRYYTVCSTKPFSYRHIFCHMEKEGINYEIKKEEGIIIASSKSLPLKIREDSNICNGRIYAVFAAQSIKRIEYLKEKFLNKVLKGLATVV